jgi:hypothetical protein
MAYMLKGNDDDDYDDDDDDDDILGSICKVAVSFWPLK